MTDDKNPLRDALDHLEALIAFARRQCEFEGDGEEELAALKAARAALSPPEQVAGPRFVADIGPRTNLTIDSVSELLRLINGGAQFKRIALSHQNTSATSIPVSGCNMGVGCDEAGRCYAEANGQPERCPNRTPPTEHSSDKARTSVSVPRLTESQWRSWGLNEDGLKALRLICVVERDCEACSWPAADHQQGMCPPGEPAYPPPPGFGLRDTALTDEDIEDLFTDAITDAADMDTGPRDYAKACVKALRKEVNAPCKMCDGFGYKDHAWLRMEPCDHDAKPSSDKARIEELEAALRQIEMQSTNIAGDFDTDPWRFAQALGDIARAALTRSDQ